MKTEIIKYMKGYRPDGTPNIRSINSPTELENAKRDGIHYTKIFNITTNIIESLEDFETLINSEEQRLYIIATGLAAVEAAKIYRKIRDSEEECDFNTLELLNEPPVRRKNV